MFLALALHTTMSAMLPDPWGIGRNSAGNLGMLNSQVVGEEELGKQSI
jgi:hypothetical protein